MATSLSAIFCNCGRVVSRLLGHVVSGVKGLSLHCAVTSFVIGILTSACSVTNYVPRCDVTLFDLVL